MDAWFIIIVSFSLCLLIKAFFNLLFPSPSHPLPPGPPHIPIIGNFLLLLRKSLFQHKPNTRDLHAKYGPMVTLTTASQPEISISDPSLAHHVLVQNGAVFSNRPKPKATAKIFNSNQHNINSAFYGPTWRLLRRNLTSEMLHPNRIKSFSEIRRWVLDSLLNRLESDSQSGNSIKIIDHLHDSMFCLLGSMCFGERLDDQRVKDIENVQLRLLVNVRKFYFLNFWPRVTRILFRKSWEELFQTRKEQDDAFISLIRLRMNAKEERKNNKRNEDIVPYVDTLLELELPEEKRNLHESEMVALCSEFILAGTETTATALQWILANLVKHSHIQQRVVDDIREVMGVREDRQEVKEEDLNRLPYLKAVILEGLRLHPPMHFLLPHAISEDVVLNGYLMPKNGTVHFMVAEIGRDPKLWEDPMEFKPERFLNCEKNEGEALFDMTGSKEIKMLPFGAGRRMCPGFNLAILHLEYFVANLIWNFEWKSSSSNGVDLSEKDQGTTVMKYPLQVSLSPRL